MKTSVIEDKRIIEKIKEEYRRRGWIRDLILFTLSINTGAKLVNLLELKISDTDISKRCRNIKQFSFNTC